MLLIPEHWRGVAVECELGDLSLIDDWVQLWDRLGIATGYRLPDRLIVRRSGELLELSAIRDGALSSLKLSIAELSSNPRSFGLAAEVVMHGLFSRRGQPSIPK